MGEFLRNRAFVFQIEPFGLDASRFNRFRKGSVMTHFGDPCVYCGVGHDDVPRGPCAKAPTDKLTDVVRNLSTARQVLDLHERESKAESDRLKSIIIRLQTVIAHHEAGLEAAKIELGGSVLKVYGAYAKAGADRASVIHDAVQWLATGKCAAYRGLDAADFGTKNYEHWSGQRSDHEWGGPRHGSICFQVGLKDRKRALTADETEAAIYYLLNLQRIQEAAAAARESIAA